MKNKCNIISVTSSDCSLLVTKTYHPHAEIDHSDVDTDNDYMYIVAANICIDRVKVKSKAEV